MEKSKRDEKKEELIRAAVNNSPYYLHLRMRVVEFDEAGSHLALALGGEHKNIWGSAHGGALASLADSACGTAVAQRTEGPEKLVTVDLRIQYLKPVTEGEIHARGRLVHRTRSWAFAECDIFGPGGALIARAQSMHSFINKDRKS